MHNLDSIQSALHFGENQLQYNGISNYKKESEWLLLHVLRQNSSWLLVNKNQKISKKDIKCFIDLLNKRSDHIPLQLIMGKATFYGRDFLIEPNVFIPRPESELIIDILKKKSFIH
tara:strand:+ start:206 stop:553 length:348 start_codon:yes stop_codon:yes gene_type:complete